MHLIADNLGWFRDGKTNIQDIMKEKGDTVKTNIDDNSIAFDINYPEEEKPSESVEELKIEEESKFKVKS